MSFEQEELAGGCEPLAVDDWAMRLNERLVPCAFCKTPTAKDPPGWKQGFLSLCPKCRDEVGPFPDRAPKVAPISEELLASAIVQEKLRAAVAILRGRLLGSERLTKIRECWMDCITELIAQSKLDEILTGGFSRIYESIGFLKLDAPEQDRQMETWFSRWAFYSAVVRMKVEEDIASRIPSLHPGKAP